MASNLTNALLRVAYRLDTSKNYATTKSFFRNLLLNDSYRYKKYFDYSMIVVVLISVGIYIYDIKEQVGIWLWGIEIFAIFLFAIEYLLRFWVHSDIHKLIISKNEEWVEMVVEPSWRSVFFDIAKNKLLFVLHPMSIVDFLSIHPELRPLRLFKIFRYSEITRGLLGTLATKKYEFGVLLILISMTVFIASSLFYVFEADNEKVTNYFDAIYWAVITIATVGYGDVVPTTTGSKIASIFLVFAGLGVLAMLTSLVTTTLGQRISAVREQKNNQHIENLHDYTLICGFGKMGEDLCVRIARSNMDFVVVDIDKNRTDRAKSLGFRAFLADASRVETLKMLDIGQKAKAIIAVTKNDITNISIILAARSISSHIKIIAKSNETNNEQKMLFAGADEVIGLKQGALALAEFLGSPIAFQAIRDLIVDDKHILADELSVGKCKKPIFISSLDMEQFGCLALAVKKESGEYIFNPSETLELCVNDKIIVIGRPKRIEGLKLKLLRRESA